MTEDFEDGFPRECDVSRLRRKSFRRDWNGGILCMGTDELVRRIEKKRECLEDEGRKDGRRI